MDTEKIKKGFVRFFSNPNTITFIIAIVAIIVLYYVYAYMVDNAVQPSTLLYANSTLYENHQITTDDISSIDISGSFISSQSNNLVQSRANVINKFVATNYRIPVNSFFYSEALTSEDSTDTTVFSNIADNYTIYKLETDFHETYGCSIMDGDYIDIFLKTYVQDEVTGEELLVYDKFIESIQVLMVVNEDGENVFTQTEADDSLNPKYIYFAVPIETYRLLQIADRGTLYDMDLIPVPRDTSYSENPKEPSIASTAIEGLIYEQESSID